MAEFAVACALTLFGHQQTHAAIFDLIQVHIQKAVRWPHQSATDVDQPRHKVASGAVEILVHGRANGVRNAELVCDGAGLDGARQAAIATQHAKRGSMKLVDLCAPHQLVVLATRLDASHSAERINDEISECSANCVDQHFFALKKKKQCEK